MTSLLRKRWIAAGVGLAFSVACIWLIASRVNLPEIMPKIARFGLVGLLTFGALHGGAQILRAIRLWMLAGPASNLSIGGAIRAIFVGYAANNLVPLRVGEVVKASVLSRLSVYKLPQTLGLVALERVMDGLILVGLLLVGLAGLPDSSKELAGVRKMAGVMTIVFGAALVGLLLIIGLRRRIETWLQGRRPVVVSTALVRLLGVLSRLADMWLVLRLVAVGLAIWFLEVSVFWLAARWIGLDVGLAGALLCQGVAALGIAVPSAPGNLGVFEAAVVVAVVVLGGDEQAGLAMGVAIHAAHWLLDTTIGLVLLPGLGLKLGGDPKGGGPDSSAVGVHR